MSTESSMDVNVLSEHVNEGHIDHCYREEVRWVEKLKAYRDKKKGAKISEDLTKEQHTLIIFEKLVSGRGRLFLAECTDVCARQYVIARSIYHYSSWITSIIPAQLTWRHCKRCRVTLPPSGTAANVLRD